MKKNKKMLICASLLATMACTPLAACADTLQRGSAITAHQVSESMAEQKATAHKLANVFAKHGFNHAEIVGAVGVAYYETKLDASSVSILGNEKHVGLYNWSGKVGQELINKSTNGVPSLDVQLDYLDHVLPKHIKHTNDSQAFAKAFLERIGKTNVYNHQMLANAVDHATELLK